jgi:colanic acid/amylovoran biosynthesis glycosyltransferase
LKSMHDNNHTINNQTRLNREAVLAIVCPQVGAVSETFIRKHIEHIAPDRTVLLTGNVLDDSWFHGNVKIIPIKSGFASFTPDVETAVVDFFRENRVTHILCEFGCIGGAVVELNHRILHLPMYVHFHGQDASEYLKKTEIVAYYRWMSNHVDGIITVSKPMAARLIEISIPEHKIKLIHSGVDCITGEKANPELSPCRFISVSRLVGKKGIHFVLNAFEKAKKAIPGLTLDLIGDGPLRADIEQFIADHNLLDSVKLHGNQPHGFVLEMLRKSSVLVQHSIVDPETGNREGLPISILEAASLGLPIISTFHEGIPEAVAHEVTGFLVKEGDWERMADYMIELAGDGKVRKKMGTAGRKKILNDGFTVSAMVAKIREFMGLNSSCAVKSAQSGKGTRILFVNHNLYPFENSGTPISTLNHALGMYDNGLEVAVLIPAPELRDGYKKQINDKFILYKLPRLDKHSTFLGEIDESFLEKYMKSVEQIIDDFAPDIVQINDYVYMPEAIVSLFHQKGAWVVRNVCNLEEICHMDYPVISDGLDGKLCSGPETPRQCAECYLRHKVAKDRKDIETGLLDELTSKIQRRIDAVQKNYDEAVDGVIFTENSFIDYFTRFIALDQKKTVTIPRGFQFRSKRKSTAKQISSNEIRFAFIGNLMFSKGPDIVLKAFAEIAALDNFTLEIYGAIVEDGYRRWIEQLEAKYPDKIKYHGKYQKEDIEKIAAAIDVALVTSYFDTYNRVVRELMYRGVPLIVTDFFGSSIVQDQATKGR